MTSFIFSQTLTDKYLHFKTDYYWDTTLYKSQQDFYFEINKGDIIQKDYPVLQYLFSTIDREDPSVKKDSFERHNVSYPAYKYLRKGNNIYIQYYDAGKRKLQLNKEYSLNRNDTVRPLAQKYSLDAKDGITVGGFSTYLGESKIESNGMQFNTFRFLENHDELSSHPSYITIEVFLEQTTLLPIKFITTHYDYKTRKKELYSSITSLTSSSNTLPDYTTKKTEDLILFEIKSTIWTEEQKKEF